MLRTSQINLRVAEATKKALERNGIQVKIGHMISMAEKCAQSDAFDADLHVPIHTNAYNGSVSGTRMFCYNTTGEGYKACKAIFARLAKLTPGKSENIKVYDELYEVRIPSAPTAYIEVDFHDVPSVAKWIIKNTTLIGETIAQGICDYFGISFKSAPAKKTTSTSNKVSITLPKLRKGSNSGYVKTVQILLNKYNKAGLVEDGGFGSKTDAAVRAYQKSRGLGVDGIVGIKTWGQLLK